MNDELNTAAADDAEEQTGAQSAQRTAVVAEDESLIRMDIVETLTEAGFDVVAAVGDGTHAVVAPACGWEIFCLTISAIRSVMAHMPLPIWARPARPSARPASTLASS